ncbi:MAG TPA: InlB B-repeat-containing protein, partial [Bacilli bacterium]|nr:InlB B-repeat-containing protein [Bacilli bacterium]
MKRIFLFFLLVLGVFTLVACDNTKYTITYELDGGTLTNEVTSFTKKDLPVTLPTPTRDGYVFLGWYLDSEFSGEPVTKITEAKNITVYAKWISELEKLDNEIKAIIEAYKNALQGSVRFEAGPDSDV